MQTIVKLSGTEYMTYKGVLDKAHSAGLTAIKTRILQVPEESNGNIAIVEAEVVLTDPETGLVKTFIDIADAAFNNVGPQTKTALLRMASTRAKGRALRDAVNIGETLAEELADMQDASPARGGRPAAAATTGKPEGCTCAGPKHFNTNPNCALNRARKAAPAAPAEEVAEAPANPSPAPEAKPTGAKQCEECGKAVTAKDIEASQANNSEKVLCKTCLKKFVSSKSA